MSREFTKDQIEAANALGIPVEQLVGTFQNPEFREGLGYTLKVKRAKNVFSKKGAHQVMLTIVPIDGAGKEVPSGQFNQWVSYPFDVAGTGYKFPTPRDRETARKNLAFFLRLAKPELNSYTVSTVGNEKIYKDLAGNVISATEMKGIFDQDRINVLKAARAAETDPGVFVGVTYTAVFSPWLNRDGEKQFSFNYLSATPIEGKTYVSNRSEMFGPSGTDGGPTMDSIDDMV